MKIGSVLRGLCPQCHEGPIMDFLSVRKRCIQCDYNFYPEPGFYLGAMMVAFLSTAILTVPPLVVLKILGFSVEVLVFFPLIEFLFLGGFLLYFSRIVWLHLEYEISRKLDQDKSRQK